MADGPMDGGYAPRRTLSWTDTFRVFQVALDPRKLVVAAAGLLAMSLGWYLLSLLFFPGLDAAPKKTDPAYSNTEARNSLGSRNPDPSEEDLAREGERLLHRDEQLYTAWLRTAGPNGRLRTLPWFEYRGPNPFVALTDAVAGTAVERQELAGRFVSGTVPVLVEPLNKLLLPLVAVFDPANSFVLRLYLILCFVWSVVCWAFFAGVITRIAAVQLTGRDRVTLPEAVRFVANRYTSYLLAPLVPVALILLIVVAMAVYGLVALIPGLGDVIMYGLGLPLVLLGGVVMAVLLVGLVGLPLMFATVSTEGTDTFDALSRAYNYVFQAPWTYLGYAALAVLYGALVTFFVVFLGSLAVYLGKWAVSQAPLSERTNRRPDYLFIYAPESFGWKELLLKGSDAEVDEHPRFEAASGRKFYEYTPTDKGRSDRYFKSLYLTEKIGAGLATFWTTLVLLLVIGFSYSYFWSASTLIYLAMRQTVDETEPDEVYLDDEQPEPLPPVTGTTTATGPGAGGLTLPTVTPPNPAPTVAPPGVSPPSVSSVAPPGGLGDGAGTAPAAMTPPAPPPGAVQSVPLSPTVSAPPGSTLTTVPVPPPAAAASPEVGVPVRADGELLRSEPAPASPPPASPPPLPPPPTDGDGNPR